MTGRVLLLHLQPFVRRHHRAPVYALLGSIARLASTAKRRDGYIVVPALVVAS